MTVTLDKQRLLKIIYIIPCFFYFKLQFFFIYFIVSTLQVNQYQ